MLLTGLYYPMLRKAAFGRAQVYRCWENRFFQHLCCFGLDNKKFIKHEAIQEHFIVLALSWPYLEVLPLLTISETTYFTQLLQAATLYGMKCTEQDG